MRVNTEKMHTPSSRCPPTSKIVVLAPVNQNTAGVFLVIHHHSAGLMERRTERWTKVNSITPFVEAGDKYVESLQNKHSSLEHLSGKATDQQSDEHSEKFKMNEDVDSFLSEKVSNLLLT